MKEQESMKHKKDVANAASFFIGKGIDMLSQRALKNMIFNCFKAFCTNDMFDTAGIIDCNFRGNP